MSRFFTADCHFGHANIIPYAERPWIAPGEYTPCEGSIRGRWQSEAIRQKRVDQMNAALVRNWNQRVTSRDTVYHLGDFCFFRGKLGGTEPAWHWEEQLNGNIVHIHGNHDGTNKIRGLTSATIYIGLFTAMLTHRPPVWHADILPKCDTVVCGHVHNNWKIRWIDNIIVINTGVDVNNYAPVSEAELIIQIEQAYSKRRRRHYGTQRDGQHR